MPEQLLTAGDVAKWLNITEGALATLRHRGGGPEFIKDGRWIRYRPRDVESWIEARRRSRT